MLKNASAFSVAVHADPDVLLIDEVLAVGNESFIGKCYERDRGVPGGRQDAGHGLARTGIDQRWCHKAVWSIGEPWPRAATRPR